jgi:protein-disulfide isomerase
MKKIVHLLLFLILAPLSSWTIAEQDSTLNKADFNAAFEEYMQTEGFTARVEEVIVDFIQKQNQAQVDATEQAASAKVVSIPNVDPINDYIRGSSSAAYSLIEYSDFECPFCKNFHHTAQQR